eukprot:479705-Pleurochrysis_carterae.AAC.1
MPRTRTTPWSTRLRQKRVALKAKAKRTITQANSDSVDSKSPGEHAEAPAPADGPDDPPPEGVAQPSGPAVQGPAEELAFENFKRQVRLCQTPEVCYLLPPEATTAQPLKIHVGPQYDTDVITATALRRITGLDNAE